MDGWIQFGIHSVDQDDLELRDQPASVSQVLGLKACATLPGLIQLSKSPAHTVCTRLVPSHDLVEL